MTRQPRWTRDDDEPFDDAEVGREEHRRRRRALCTLLKFWTACPKRACRRHRRCCDPVAFCEQIFWPELPEEFRVRYDAIEQAHDDGATARQADLRAEVALRRWQSLKALGVSE